MTVKIKEFKNGVFILEYIDNDLLFNPIDIKLSRYPNDISLADKSYYSDLLNHIYVPSVDNMSYEYIDNLLSDIKITYCNKYKPLISELDYYDIPWYYEYLKSSTMYCFLFKNNIYDTASISIDGLELIVHLDEHSRINIKSSFQFLGHSNHMSRWYLEILNKYMIGKLDNHGFRKISLS